MLYYVYKLVDPRTKSPFYIGKGKGNRVSAHVKDAKAGKGCNFRKTARILEILADGLDVQEVIVQRFDDEASAYQAEVDLIDQIGIENLTNISRGGAGGPSGMQVTTARKRLDEMEADAYKLLAPYIQLERAAARMGYDISPSDTPSGRFATGLKALAAQRMLDIRRERRRLLDKPDDERIINLDFYYGGNQQAVEFSGLNDG